MLGGKSVCSYLKVRHKIVLLMHTPKVNPLMVIGIWGVVQPPLLQDFFLNNIGILYGYDF